MFATFVPTVQTCRRVETRPPLRGLYGIIQLVLIVERGMCVFRRIIRSCLLKFDVRVQVTKVLFRQLWRFHLQGMCWSAQVFETR